MSVSAGEINVWLHDEVTVEFLKNVNQLKEHNDFKVHQLLQPKENSDFQNQMLQSSFYNAAISALDEVVDIPNQMLFDLQETLTEE